MTCGLDTVFGTVHRALLTRKILVSLLMGVLEPECCDLRVKDC